MIDFDEMTADYLAVWNEDEADARLAAAERLFAADVAYTDPMGDVRGVNELAAVVAGVQAQFPGWRFRRSGPVDGHGSQVRFGWELGPEDGDAPIAGFDVAVLNEEGRIRQVLGFLDRVPG
ncbi:MAG: nuclear transport factor 2 family protein [Pseudonocardiales bacterium]|nr:nuclear transport factor 2 family protein [Pseudonocardiales bacterium]